MEGVVFRRLDGAYQPSVRGWEKCKVRETSEAIVGAITGSRAAPRTLLLGRYDTEGRFQYVERTTSLARAAGAVPARVRSRPGRRVRSGGRRLPRGLARQPPRQRVRDARRLLSQSSAIGIHDMLGENTEAAVEEAAQATAAHPTDPWRTIGARSRRLFG
jgi:hypothetical protein